MGIVNRGSNNQGRIQKIQKEGAESPTLSTPNENFTLQDMQYNFIKRFSKQNHSVSSKKRGATAPSAPPLNPPMAIVEHILRTFAPIATTHLYCARHSLSTHMPRHFQARALSRKVNKNIELVTLALTWCANIFVGCSVAPYFFFGRSLPFLILSIILKNKKNLCGKF